MAHVPMSHTKARSSVALSLPGYSVGRIGAIAARVGGAGLLVAIGLIHLIAAPGHFEQQPYVGVLFWLAAAGSFLAALGILFGIGGAWILGAFLALSTFVGLLLATTIGLPNFSEDLSDSLAVASLFVEGAFLVLYAGAATHRSTPLGT